MKDTVIEETVQNCIISLGSERDTSDSNMEITWEEDIDWKLQLINFVKKPNFIHVRHIF